MKRPHFIIFSVFTALFFHCAVSFAQYSYDYGRNAVGGVITDATGMVSQATVADMKNLSTQWKKAVLKVETGLQGATDSRSVSLKKLNDLISACHQAGKEIPQSALLLGGLTAVEYVFVYPEEQDIVLVGPAEEWIVGPMGVFVGKTTGKPIMLLDDLITTLRAAQGRQRNVFSVSIDPDPAGIQRFREYTKTLGTVSAANTQQISKTMSEKLGPQIVTVSGIPANTHFAAVMAAADFRMKQISMGATKSPVPAIPSFVSMMKTPTDSQDQPRWWLAPNYDAITRDADGLAWNLKGGKVVTLTETDYVDGNQIIHGGGKASPIYGQWAKKMTDNYDALAKVEPIFGQLRTCMDAAVVAAIITENGLLKTANLPLPAFFSSETYKPLEMNVPKNVPSTAVMARKGNFSLIVNGGVSIDLWKIAGENKVVKDLSPEGKEVTGEAWWK